MEGDKEVWRRNKGEQERERRTWASFRSLMGMPIVEVMVVGCVDLEV